jgi:hydroxyethylthiazole kinase-like uncharacterized protein yjeF
MRTAEQASGVDEAALMDRAGAAIAEVVRRIGGGQEVLVLCGPGNNGGDGYVAASALRQAGIPVRVAALSDPRTDLARRARAGWAGPVEPIAEASAAPVLLDALFGTGLSRGLDEPVVESLHALSIRAVLTIAVDLPSGVATDSGALLSAYPGAALTLALGAPKPAHLLLPAAPLCGTVRVLDIGIAARSQASVLPVASLRSPAVDAHKFSRGMVAVVAGRMPGASALAASAAARVAGYVLLIGSATDRLPHAIVRRRWAEDGLFDPRIGAVVIGPGLGPDEEARAKLNAALASDHALVIDGDALRLLDPARLRSRASPAILTPHEGEFAHLFPDVKGSKIDRARTAAGESGATVVLKGPDTIIAAPTGEVRLAARHVPWLATAGSGDVLAGLTGALLAGPDTTALAAASSAVWLHTEAARIAGPALTADDLTLALPAAIAQAGA